MKKAKPTKNRLSRMELQLMQVLWRLKAASIREIQEALPRNRQIEYTTVQTMIYRLEKKGALHRTRKIGNAHIFEPLISPQNTITSLVDELLSFFDGSAAPVMAHMAEAGQLTLEDIKELENTLKTRAAEEKKS